MVETRVHAVEVAPGGRLPVPELVLRLLEATFQFLPRLVAEQTLLLEALELPAEVRIDADRVARISPTVDGQVIALLAGEGEHVREGQQLAVLNSRELAGLQAALADVIAAHRPDRAAAEQVFVNKNPQSTLKLAQARGCVLAACGAAGLAVNEHAARLVKKAVVGTGHADKDQVAMMIARLLPGCDPAAPDAADALAVAVCHAHHAATGRQWAAGVEDPLAAASGHATSGGRR